MNPARPQLGGFLLFKDKLRDCDMKFTREIVTQRQPIRFYTFLEMAAKFQQLLFNLS